MDLIQLKYLDENIYKMINLMHNFDVCITLNTVTSIKFIFLKRLTYSNVWTYGNIYLIKIELLLLNISFNVTIVKKKKLITLVDWIIVDPVPTGHSIFSTEKMLFFVKIGWKFKLKKNLYRTNISESMDNSFYNCKTTRKIKRVDK